MKFTKMQGCGNDYVYVDCISENAEVVENPSELSIRVSDRHFGIGSDGLILICPSEVADVRMAMFNADGSEGAMCGNGSRCVAKYAFDHGICTKKNFTLETLSGIKELEVHPETDPVTGKTVTNQVTVGMGAAAAEPNVVLSAGEYSYEFTPVNVGNPHAVTFIDDVDNLRIEGPGPLFESHEHFPERANIEFVQIIDRSHVKMRVWERGSAETFACGTGACATGYACVINGLTDDVVTVSMLGGDLTIEVDRESGKIRMTGPAVEVFTGEI